jgi:hypothetical protein
MRNLGRASFENVWRVSSPNSLQRSKESRPRTVLGFLEYRQTLHSGFLSEHNRSQNPRERTIEGLSVSEYQSSNVNPNFKTDGQAFSRSYGRKGPVRSITPSPAGQEFPPTAAQLGAIGDRDYSPLTKRKTSENARMPSAATS